MKKIKTLLLLPGMIYFNIIFATTPCYVTILHQTQYDSKAVETYVHSLLTKYIRPYPQIPPDRLSSNECLDSLEEKIYSKEPDKIYVLLEHSKQSYIAFGDT